MDPLDPMFLEQLRDPTPGNRESAVHGGSAAWDMLGSDIFSMCGQQRGSMAAGQGASMRRIIV